MGSSGSRNRRHRAKRTGNGSGALVSSCASSDVSQPAADAFHLYAHDDELAERVCASAVVRSVAAGLLVDANTWFARCEAADEAAGESEQTRKTKRRDGSPTPATKLDEARHPREKNMLERIASESDADGGISTPSLKDSVRLEKLQREFGSVVKANGQKISAFVRSWRERVWKLHTEVQESYEKTLESAIREHERTWVAHRDAEKRFHKLTGLKGKRQSGEDSLETQKSVDSVNTEINALIAQLERLEELIKQRCEDFTAYYIPHITHAIHLYSLNQIDKFEECNDSVALTAATSVEALREEFHSMVLPSKAALESPPTPPKMKTSKRRHGDVSSLPSTSAASATSDAEELEEGEIREQEPPKPTAPKAEAQGSVVASAAAA